MQIKKANELIKDNQLAVVVFTKGALFTFDAFGNGETGNWVVDKENMDQVDKVIVYNRDDESGTNRVFMGNYGGIRQSPQPNRQVIKFTKLAEMGTTDSNWNEFADSGQNPVSYVGYFY